MPSFAEQIAEGLSEDRLNVVTGKRSPSIIDVERKSVAEHDKLINCHTFSGHPSVMQEVLWGVVDQCLQSFKPDVVFSDRIDVLRELEILASTGEVQLKWFVCDDELETSKLPSIPNCSILRFAMDQSRRGRPGAGLKSSEKTPNTSGTSQTKSNVFI